MTSVGPVPGDRVLTVRQPWAALLASGVKNIENRSRRTNYRGRVWIHASGYSQLGLRVGGHKLWAPQLFQVFRDSDGCWVRLPGSSETVPLLFGTVVGSVELIDCARDHWSPWAEPDSWHWVVTGAERLSVPVPAKGRLGIWTWPEVTE